MIISFLAPRGGVGSSTLAVLTASYRAENQKVLLIDAAEDPSIDLYTSTENSVPEYYDETHRLPDESVRGIENLWVARLRSDRVIDKTDLKGWLRADGIADLILDFGAVSKDGLALALALSDQLIVVLTQDNPVLRAADELLGQIRTSCGDAGFIINQWEDRAVSELGDRDEIFSLLEENCYGSVSYDHNLRFLMNQGKPLDAPHLIGEEIRLICDKIYHGLADTEETSEDTSEEEIIDIESLVTGSVDADSRVAELSHADTLTDQSDDTILTDTIVDESNPAFSARVLAQAGESLILDTQEPLRVPLETGADRLDQDKEPDRDGVLTRIRSFFRRGKG